MNTDTLYNLVVYTITTYPLLSGIIAILILAALMQYTIFLAERADRLHKYRLDVVQALLDYKSTNLWIAYTKVDTYKDLIKVQFTNHIPAEVTAAEIVRLTTIETKKEVNIRAK